jgi:hypothetical protein
MWRFHSFIFTKTRRQELRRSQIHRLPSRVLMGPHNCLLSLYILRFLYTVASEILYPHSRSLLNCLPTLAPLLHLAHGRLHSLSSPNHFAMALLPNIGRNIGCLQCFDRITFWFSHRLIDLAFATLCDCTGMHNSFLSFWWRFRSLMAFQTIWLIPESLFRLVSVSADP